MSYLVLAHGGLAVERSQAVHLVALVLCAFFQAPHPQAPPPLTAEPLVGVVVGEDGEPRAGVEVLLSSGSLPASTQPVLGMALWTERARPPFADERPVLGRTRTDAAGRFRLNLPDEVVRSQEPLAVALWAYQEGGRAAFERLPWAIPAPAEPVRLVLRAPAPAAFRIVGPDGMPDFGARLGAAAVGRVVVPAELTALLGATAGDDGVAVVHAFAADQISAVWIDSPRFGRQKVQVSPAAGAEPRLVKLEPSGHIVGRVVTDENVPVVGLKLQARTMLAGSDASGACAWAEAITDRDGGFTIPAIAAGRLLLTLDFRSRPDLPYRGLPPANQVVEPGQTATVPIRLTRAVQLDGLIRERGTGLPIAGVSPEIPDPASQVGGNPPVVTDARGRFAGCMEHDQPYAFIYATPRPYFVPADAPDDFQLLPAGATKFTLPPTELVRGVALRGTVVDDAGKGVAGALVRASWASKNVAHQSVATRTSARGTFLEKAGQVRY
jgi:hypothetical protein